MPHPRLRRAELWSCAAALLILLLGYMLLWWNRGIQLNSNGMPTLAAQAILAGKLPYRDFHFWCPPGHLLVYTALAALFGDALIYVRAFAVAERMAIFLTAYFWLARFFAPRWVFFGTLAAGIGFSSDVCDVIAHYDYDSLLAALLAGYFASLAISARGLRAAAFCLAAGVSAGLCLICKQTLGIGLLPIFPVIFLITLPRQRLKAVTAYFAGCLLPVVPTYLWLSRGGAWKDFLNLTFLQGTSSKGSLLSILFRPLITLTYSGMLLTAFLLALITLALYLRSTYRETPRLQSKLDSPLALGLLSSAALLIGLLIGYSRLIDPSSDRQMKVLMSYSDYCIFLAFIGTAALAVYYTFLALTGKLTPGDAQKWILACVSFVTAYMFSLSWAAFEPMLLPGLAFLLAFALDRHARLRTGRLRVPMLIVLGLALIATAAVRKLTWPYNWHNWVDAPIRAETAPSPFPELRGLRLAPETDAFLSRVTQLIQANSRPDETIVCFPNYTLFYVIAHRAPAVFAYMHWFDITPDYIAREDTARIRAARPAVVLMVDMPEYELRQNERWFRGGARSGQRDMIAAIQSLPGYRLAETVPIPHIEYPLKVYVRD